MGSTTIEDLPDPVIEYILSYLSPYRDLKQCMQVSKAWQKHVYDVVRKIKRDFNNAVMSMTVQWQHLLAEPGPTISKRYSHSACCSGNNMYIFGGCTTANTTFNDLWRLNLSTRRWVRPLATGTYPPPKACATLVCYEDNLVLFGGWTHNSPYPLHQVWRVFNHLHMYNIRTNRWTQVVTPLNSPAMAGHSATVHGDMMVVFGGIQKQTGEGPSSRFNLFYCASEVWLLNLKTLNWKKQPTNQVKPLPRYGHSQVSIDEKHLLVMGGCGGPNMLFNDIWLLTMSDNLDEPWTWQQLKVECRENAAPHLAFHPACRVGDQVVVMSKTQKSRGAPSSLPYLLRAPSRIWVPPRAENENGEARGPQQPADVETCVNGKKGVLKRHYERRQAASASPAQLSSDEDEYHSRNAAKKKLATASTHSSTNGSISHDTLNTPEPNEPSTSSIAAQADPSGSASADEPKQNLPQEAKQASASPTKDAADQQSRPVSVRPNARCNRQRQLEGLDRMEQRLRVLRGFPLSMVEDSKKLNKHLRCNRNPMCIYVLDISKAISDGYVTWRVLKNQCATAPEEIILYSLVLGRGEMIMFGGIQKDLNSRQQEGESIPEIVSNSLHFMSAQRVII